MLNHSLIADFPIDPALHNKMDKVFKEVEQANTESIIGQLYKLSSQMLKQEPNQYEQLKSLLDEHSASVHIDDKKILYAFMHTFCVKSNNPMYINKVRKLYVRRFEEGLLHEGEFISLMNAKGLCTTLLRFTQATDPTERLSKIAAEEKMQEVVQELRLEHRKSTLQFHLGVLEFYFKNYIKAIQILMQKTKYANAFFDFDARTVLLRSYYLLDDEDDDAFYNQIRTFKLVLKKDKSISDAYKLGYSNFIDSIRMLQEIKYKFGKNEKRISIEKLEKFMSQNPPTVLSWLQTQLNLLKQ